MKMKTVIVLLAALLLSMSAGAKGKVDKDPDDILYGPWVTNVSEESFTVVWRTKGNTLAWLEYAPDDGSNFNSENRPRLYETSAGRRMAGELHTITVYGLEPGSAWRYRLGGRRVVDASNAYRIVYDGEYEKNVIHTVRTFSTAKDSCRFTMVNDMHFKDARYSNLTRNVDCTKDDFIFLGGDIISFADALDTLLKHTFQPISRICGDLPVVFARGNHEGRGAEWYLTSKAFPTKTGEYYYTFRCGPVAFLVLDAGEDKPDSSPEYSGYADYDAYREAELEWMKSAVREPEFAGAPFKVCLIHIPTICDKGSWYTQKWINRNFNPVLNEAGIDLMLSGHHHRYIFREKGSCGNNFPIVANSNVERLDFRADSDKITLSIYDESGKLTRSLEVVR